MATINKGLVQQAYNTSTGTLPAGQTINTTNISTPYTDWSVPINYDYAAIDLALGGSVTIDTTAIVVDRALLLGEYQPTTIIFTGTLSASRIFSLPSSVGGSWIVYNNTTPVGGATITISTPSGTSLSVVIPAGGPYNVVCNSTSGISFVPAYLVNGTVTSSILASDAVTTAKILDANVTTAKLDPTILQSFVPAGAVMPYAGSAAPTGWLLCYGQSVSTTTYATLFAAIGYAFGGSGSNFNIPDMRGRLAAGKDNMGGTAASRLTGTYTVTVSTVVRATNVVTLTTSTAHGLSVGETFTLASVVDTSFNGTFTVSSVTSSTIFTYAQTGTDASSTGGTITATLTGGITGSTLGASGGAQSHTLDTSEMPLHGHPIRLSTTTQTTYSSNGQGGMPMSNANTISNNTFTGIPTNTFGQQLGGQGGNGPHNNVQPTLILNYIIKT